VNPVDTFKTLAATLALVAGSHVAAQTTLKWAHVYETSEPFHTESVWAAQEIERRTNGRYHIDVYPASQLGKEADINQGLTLGTVDMIISASSFAARSFPRIGVTYYPYVFRGPEHLLAYTKSDIYDELTRGYEAKTGNRIVSTTYYGTRHSSTSNRLFTRCADMKGRGGLFSDATRLRCQYRTDCICRGLPSAAKRYSGRTRKPAHHHRSQEILRSAKTHHFDRAYSRSSQHRDFGPALAAFIGRR